MNPPLAFDPFLDPRAAEAAGVRPVAARRAAGRGRLRLDPLPAHRPDARPDRRPRARADEARRLPDQHGPGRDRRRGRALRRARDGAGSPARRSTASPTSRSPAAPLRRARQRAARPALHRLDRRAVPRHRPRRPARGCSTSRSARRRAAWSTRRSSTAPASGRNGRGCRSRSGVESRVSEEPTHGPEAGRTDRVDQRGRLGHRRGHGAAVRRRGGERRARRRPGRPGRGRRATPSRRAAATRSFLAVRRRRRGATSASSIAETVARFGGLNILVNCAGLVHVGLLHEYDEADWDRLMDVNVKSIFFSVKHGLPHLRRNAAELRGERRLDQQLRRPGRGRRPTRPRRRPCWD